MYEKYLAIILRFKAPEAFNFYQMRERLLTVPQNSVELEKGVCNLISSKSCHISNAASEFYEYVDAESVFLCTKCKKLWHLPCADIPRSFKWG